MLLDTATSLAPGRVIEVVGARVRLALGEEEVWAISAMAYPYQPVAGDLLLTIGQGEDYYVIGVIEGRGKCTFTAPGALEFRAPHGPVTFASAEGIRMTGGRVEIVTHELDVKAESLTENVGESYRRVRDVADLRAGEIRQHAEGTCRVKAETIIEIAEKDVNIEGEKIRLG